MLAREGRTFTASELISLYAQWVGEYHIISIEDGLAEDDWEGFAEQTHSQGSKIQVMGDDLFVTNPERLGRGIHEGICNSILIKLNQIGTLTETLATIEMAKRAGYTAVV